MGEAEPVTGNQAVDMILDPKTTEGTRQDLRRRVYRVFDDMFEESTGRRPRRNQSVWDALESWKQGKGGAVIEAWHGG